MIFFWGEIRIQIVFHFGFKTVFKSFFNDLILSLERVTRCLRESELCNKKVKMKHKGLRCSRVLIWLLSMLGGTRWFSCLVWPWFGVPNWFLAWFLSFSQAVWLWAPRGFRPRTRRMRRSSTAWRSRSATSSTSSRTSTPPGSPSPPSWTWTLRSHWRRCQTVPSRQWRSFTRPPTPSPAHSTPLNRHQQPISQGVSYYHCFSLCDGAVGFQGRPVQISRG